MTSSLVGSEMCIRDRAKKLYNLMDGRKEGTYRYRGEWGVLDQLIVSGSVSYTHLTLPTN
eukprot:9985270-Prorocentrum_lima.AAC.1